VILTKQRGAFLLRRNATDPCRFDLGYAVLNDQTPIGPNHPFPMGERAASIKFDRLSDEIETTAERVHFDSYLYNLVVLGLPEAVCDIG
jgi:hypothetical protein